MDCPKCEKYCRLIKRKKLRDENDIITDRYYKCPHCGLALVEREHFDFKNGEVLFNVIMKG